MADSFIADSFVPDQDPAKAPAGGKPTAADVLSDRVPATAADRKNYAPHVEAAVHELYPGSRFIDIIRDEKKLEAVRSLAIDKAEGLPGVPTKAPSGKESFGDFVLGQAGRAAKKTARVATGMDDPKNLTDAALQVAVTAPAIMAGGAGLGGLAAKLGLPSAVKAVAPAVGRVAASGAVGAGEAAARGENVGWRAFLDATVAGLTEGAVSAATAVPKVGLKAMGEAARGFEWATKAPEKALDMIRAKLPKVRFIVPSLGPNKLTPEEAIKALAKETGPVYEVARMEIADALSRAEALQTKMAGTAKNLGPKAGQVFKHFTSPERFTPPLTSRGAEATRRALSSPAGRATLDAAADENAQGVPVGAISGAGLLEGGASLHDLARRIVPLIP